jgi:hypothetical protein
MCNLLPISLNVRNSNSPHQQVAVADNVLKHYRDFSPKCPIDGRMAFLCLGTCFNSLGSLPCLIMEYTDYKLIYSP